MRCIGGCENDHYHGPYNLTSWSRLAILAKRQRKQKDTQVRVLSAKPRYCVTAESRLNYSPKIVPR